MTWSVRARSFAKDFSARARRTRFFFDQRSRAAHLLATSFFAHLPTLFIPFLHIDEGGWAAISTEAFNGGLYQRLTDHKPPLIFQLHYLITLGERSILSLRLFMIVWTFLGGLALFRFLRSYLTTPTAAFYGAFLFILMSGLINYGAFAIEHCYLPLLIFAADFLRQAALSSFKTVIHPTESLPSNEKDPVLNTSPPTSKSSPGYQKALNFFIAGVCFGMACLLKQTAFLFAPVLFFVAFETQNLIRNAAIFFSAAVLVTFLSWWLTGVPFSIIWSEGYLANLNYVSFDNTSSLEDILTNATLILCVEYLPLVLGSIWGTYLIIKNAELKEWITPKGLSLIFLILMSIEAVRLGGRYYQQYYIVLLPLFCILCASGINRSRSKGNAIALLVSSFFVVLGFHCFTTFKQMKDLNKNWDSKIRALNEEILKDSTEEDTIWISHGLLPPYFATHRMPAVKNVYFHDALSHASVCRAPASLLKEDFNDVNYQEVFSNLNARKPKIIFWVQRHVNTCADRLRLQNFPELAKFIQKNYREKWRNELGIYYLKSL